MAAATSRTSSSSTGIGLAAALALLLQARKMRVRALEMRGGATICVGADAVGAASSIVALVGALSGGGDPREELQCGSGGSPPRGQRGAASAGSVEDGEAPRPRRGRGDEEEAVTEEARRPWLSSADTTDWGSKSSGQGATRARPNSV